MEGGIELYIFGKYEVECEEYEMEEDIKIIEEIVETYRSCSVNEEGFDMRVDIGFTKKECE